MINSRQTVNNDRNIPVVVSKNLLTYRQGPLIEGFGFQVLTFFRPEPSKISENDGFIQVPWSKHSFLDGEGALVEWPSLRVPCLFIQELGQVVKYTGYFLGIGSRGPLPDTQGEAVKLLSAGVVAFSVLDSSKVIDRR